MQRQSKLLPSNSRPYCSITPLFQTIHYPCGSIRFRSVTFHVFAFPKQLFTLLNFSSATLFFASACLHYSFACLNYSFACLNFSFAPLHNSNRSFALVQRIYSVPQLVSASPSLCFTVRLNSNAFLLIAFAILFYAHPMPLLTTPSPC